MDKLQEEDQQGFIMRALFGCIGKDADTSVDHAEDDIISVEFYLRRIRDQIWSNKFSLRLVGLFVMFFANIQVLIS